MNWARPVVWICAIGLGASSAMVAAQQPRDARAIGSGTGVLRGRVVTDEPNPTAVRRATVALGGSSPGRLTSTDDLGNFVLTNVPAGTYSVRVSKPGWVDSYFGSARPGLGPGRPIPVPSNQSVSIVVKLARGAAIEGTITDERGQPAGRARCQLLQMRVVNGERTLVAATGGFVSTLTDDRGAFRFYGLAPGEYLVAVTGWSGFVSGGEWRNTSVDGVDWSQRASASSSAATTTVAPFVMYAPIFYPGTSDAMTATPIVVRGAEERAGTDFSIRAVATARVTGTVREPDGQLASQNVRIRLMMKTLQPSDFVQRAALAQPTITNGTFSLSSVAPGSYALIAFATGGTTRWAARELTVDGHDVSDVALLLQPARSVSGRVVFDGTSAVPADVRVGITAVRTDLGVTVSIPPAVLGPGGTFTLSGLVPGLYRFDVKLPSDPWGLRSARVGQSDSEDYPFEVGADADVVNAVLTFNDRATELSGSVVDGAGRPATALSIVALPLDPSLQGSSKRRTKVAQVADDGRYRIVGLPPGEYGVAALVDASDADLADALVLAELARSSTRVVLGEHEKRSLDLKIATDVDRRGRSDKSTLSAKLAEGTR